ncbi:transposable element Tcb1 transposase [Trichonephila clavipes]|nr:transposable element Tcb1 transposase [Trichonephila clavipes]
MSEQRDLPESMAWRVIGRLESGQTQRSVADTVGVARSVVARMWNRFKETGNVRRRPGAGRSRATTSTDDRYIQLTARRNRTENATQLQNESQFSLESDTRRVLVWRDRGTRNNPAFVRERSQYRRAGWMVWGGISIGGRTDLHIIWNGTLTGRRERPACSPDLNPIEHVWDMLGRRIAARPRPPATVRDLEIALLEEWNSIPQSLIDNLIASMANRCAAVLAV